MVHKVKKSELPEVAKLMIQELSKEPFEEKEEKDAVIKSLEYYHQNSEVIGTTEQGDFQGILVFKQEMWWQGSVYIIENLIAKQEEQRAILLQYLHKSAKKENVQKTIFSTHKSSPNLSYYENRGYKPNESIVVYEKEL